MKKISEKRITIWFISHIFPKTHILSILERNALYT